LDVTEEQMTTDAVLFKPRGEMKVSESVVLVADGIARNHEKVKEKEMEMEMEKEAEKKE